MRMPPARATVVLVVVTVLAWMVAVTANQLDFLIVNAGFIPARLAGTVHLPGAVPVWLTPLTATLVHGGLLHIGMNMLVLGYCGRQTETVIGSPALVVLYLIGAYAAAAAQFLIGPASEVPMVGASGATSAVLAAYAIFYGERRLLVKNRRLSRALHLAWLAAGWIALQLLVAVASSAEGLMIAVAAHVGGFLAGLLLARPLLRWRYRKA